MRIRNRRSVNGVLIFLIMIFVALIVLGIVTKLIVFYILAGVEILVIILIVIALFTFLAKTGQTTSKTRRSTYDILEGHEIKGVQSDQVSKKEAKGYFFCEGCGMKLEQGVKNCPNCGKST